MFFGWEPTEQAFYLNVVDLCQACAGTGEIFGSEEVCPQCGGEGLQLAALSPSNRTSGLTLDALADHVRRGGFPFPPEIRADLESDQRSNAATLLHEYDLDG